MSYISLLSTVDIFTDLNRSQLVKIEALCSEKTFGKDEVIFEENSPSKEFYIIINGSVAIQLDPDLIRKSEDKHKPETIATLLQGQSFGEVALVDMGLRSASAVSASEDTKVLVIDRGKFMELLKADLQIGFLVMQNLAADLCFKIRNTNLMVREALLA